MQAQQKRPFFGRGNVETRPEVARTAVQRIAFLKRVYGWMFAGIIATAMGSAIAIKLDWPLAIVQGGLFLNIVLIVAWMGAAFLVQKVRHVQTWNVVAFAAYGLFTGIVFSTIIYFAMVMGQSLTGSASTYIVQAMVLTLVTFGGLSVYALTTKRDFSFMRGFLAAGLCVMIGMIVIGFFTDSVGFHLILSGVGVLLFAGYTLYDTQQVLKHTPDGEHVAAALTLFLDFVLLFFYLLRFILYMAAAANE